MMRELKLYESGIRDYNKLLEGRKAFVTTAARFPFEKESFRQ